MTMKTTCENNTSNPKKIQPYVPQCTSVDRAGDYHDEPKRARRKTLFPEVTGTENIQCRSIQDAKEVLTISCLWSHFGLEDHPATSCRSPFRRDNNPSFSVYLNANEEERFKDHGDPEIAGDSYDFFQQCTGLNKVDAFGPFLDLANDVQKSRKGLASKTIEPAKPKPLPPNFSERRLKMATFLRKDRSLCEQIAAKRNWKVETIEALANETSLGWYQGNLAFLYDTGVKVRNFLEGGERSIKWPYGASSLWRGHRIANASKIYLCEGETDVISLLDADFETDPAVGVVAVPSASTFNPAWAQLFKGKEVTLCMDGDPAGIAARQKIGAMLHPVASALKTINPEVIR
jgi:hypothetical protein